MPAFEPAEYRARTAKVREVMAKRGLEALLVMTESNMNYLTGYDGYSEYVPQLALVLQHEEDPVLILREMDLQCAYPTSYLPDARILAYPEHFIGTEAKTPWDPVAAMIRERTKSTRLGCELTAKTYGLKAHAALTKALGIDEFADADGMISPIKLVKSPNELAYMHQAARIVDRAIDTAMLAIEVGARESDVAAAVTAALCAGTAEVPGGPCKMPTMPVAPMATAPHLKWTDKRYLWNSQTNFEIGAYRHRYACPLSRTIFLGDPPPRLQHIHKAVLAGFLAAFGAMRPGATCGDAHRAFLAAFTPHGVRKESRIGYSIGVDWGDGGASLQQDDATVLQPNMTFHLIVGIWERQDGYILSEAVRITDTGAESFSRMTREMMVKA
jgi:Xaa-Pro dipeptidase